MSKPARFNQADCTRALRAAVAAGLKPHGFEVAPDGTLRIIFADGQLLRTSNTFDGLMSK